MQKQKIQYLQALESLSGLIKKEKRAINVKSLLGPSKAFFLANMKHISKKGLLVVSNTKREEEELYNDISFFISPKGPDSRNGEKEVFRFPPTGASPYEEASPRSDIISERLGVLDRLRRKEKIIIVSSAEALLQKVIRPDVLDRAVMNIQKGEAIDRDRLISKLIKGGYKRTDLVEERGEFSVRGGIVDIFPLAEAFPLRIELVGEEIDTIRRFTVEDQKSTEKIEGVRIMPVRELILDKERAVLQLKRCEKKYREELIDRIEEKGFFPGIEHISMLFDPLATLFDYLGSETILVADQTEELQEMAEQIYRDAELAFKRGIEENPLLCEPKERYMTPEELKRAMRNIKMINTGVLPSTKGVDFPEGSFRTRGVDFYQGRFQAFVEQLRKWISSGIRIIIVCLNRGQASLLKRLLEDYRIEASLRERRAAKLPPLLEFSKAPPVSLFVGRLSSGIFLPDDNLVFIAEGDIFGQRKLLRHKRAVQDRGFLSTFRELKEKDYIVHADYGIGRYIGLTKLETENVRGEFLEIEYAGGERLYIPPDRISLLQRYVGSGNGTPKLNKLGDNRWANLKGRVKRSIRKMAKELLELYAERETARGFSFSPDGPWHREFALSFEYEETEDQRRAISDVRADMEREKPMDRLVCGDVGYGKTEVAMRAAFKAALDGKQVALLVPTTILAEQHFHTFSSRFLPYPINIGVLSRFKTQKEQRSIIKGLRGGGIDIIIGTHRLLQRDVKFKDLGLVIIDEEQRFGVVDKENLKNIRRSVDVLALTATPIPRTLHLSLAGIRDMSLISTPPEERLSIKTFVRRFSKKTIREAVVNEIKRDGQVFFVHNRVERIEEMKSYLQALAPGIRIGIAHGQMSERELERTMLRFLDREIDLLLCTTIIESGLDIPSVNTIIINRSDSFGLAQLYQLRGRVGRDRRQAYAYFLVSSDEILPYDAKKRLEAIEELSELGSGFRLATRDMEIRGAGNIFGTEQSGHIAAVGFDMYCALMKEAIEELKNIRPEETVEPEIDISIGGYIPSFYIPSTNQRLEAYRKISSLREIDELQDFKKETRDIYGDIPLELKKMLMLSEIRIMARESGIIRAEQRGGRVRLFFKRGTPLPEELAGRLQKEGLDSEPFSREGIQINLSKTGWRSILGSLKKALQVLSVRDTIQKKEEVN